MVLLWPSQDNPTLKLTFGRFRNLGSFEGKMSLITDVIVENLSSPRHRLAFPCSIKTASESATVFWLSTT